jgi:hypothetical protein
MKKIVLLVASIFTIGSAIAGGDQNNALVGIQKKKEITHGGFYLHLGIAAPSYKPVDSDLRFSMGIQPSLELGNNFMFYKTDQIGIGMNVSWLTFGFSSKTKTYDYGDDYTEDIRTSSVYLSFLKLGPMATYAINDKMAVDAFFDFSPTVYFGTTSNPGADIEDSFSDGFILTGLALSPGVKFRYSKLCVGFEAQFGKLAYASTGDSDVSDFKASYFSPRVMLGFKF